jgi:hypothetical protein
LDGYVDCGFWVLIEFNASEFDLFISQVVIQLSLQQGPGLSDDLSPRGQGKLRLCVTKSFNGTCCATTTAKILVQVFLHCMVHTQLTRIKCHPEETFGGLNILFFGDFLQMPSVKGGGVY